MPQQDLLETKRVQQLNQAVRDAVESVFAGKDVGQVLADIRDKVNLSQAEMSRVIEAINVNLTTHHVRTTSGADRAQEHDIVDPDQVIPHLYPSQDAMLKAAASLQTTEVAEDIFDLRSYGQTKVKAASAVPTVDPIDRQYALIQRAKAAQQCIATVRSLVSTTYENALQTLQQAKQKFAKSISREGAYPTTEFVNFAIASLPSGIDDMAAVFSGIILDDDRGSVSSGTKSASAHDLAVCDDNIDSFIELMSAVVAVKSASLAKEEVLEITDNVDLVKVAFNLSGALVNALDRRMMASSQASEAAATRYDVYNPYNDPEFRDAMDFEEHLNQLVALEKVRTSDDILRRTDAGKVYAAYNDIFATSPEAARNPGLVRTILRQHVEQGGLDPMTVMSIAKNNADVSKSELGRQTYLMDRNDIRKDEIARVKMDAKRDKKANISAEQQVEQLRIELNFLKEALHAK